MTKAPVRWANGAWLECGIEKGSKHIILPLFIVSQDFTATLLLIVIKRILIIEEMLNSWIAPCGFHSVWRTKTQIDLIYAVEIIFSIIFSSILSISFYHCIACYLE